MRRSPRLRGLACLLAAAVVAPAVAAADRPNIVFVFSDDHAPHAIGAYGGRLAAVDPTPAIDRLAAEGALFENSFCTNSICGPSRAVILTGLHSHLSGFRHNGNRFDGSQTTFPKLLRAAGYQTAMIGKWHLRSDPQGFDHWQVLPGQGQYYNPVFRTPEGNVTIEGHCTDIVTDLAIRWLEDGRDPDKPFVLMCQHKAPHRNWMPALRHLDLYADVEIPEPATLFDRWEDNASPAAGQEMTVRDHLWLAYDLFVPPIEGEPGGPGADTSGWRNLDRMTPTQRAAWNAAFDPRNAAFRALELEGDDLVRWKHQRYMKNYLRCVRGVDESVARLTIWLEQRGLAENTVVIYASDQGFFLGDHGWYDKRWMYEESLRMPLIVRWPGVVEPGTRRTELVQNLDYAQTFLDLAGVEAPASMQGRSLVPLLRAADGDDVPWRDAIYYHYYEFPAVHQVAKHDGVRTDRFKLIHFYETDEWELYDLARDPEEMTNAYGDPTYARVVEGLKGRLEALRQGYGVPDGGD